LDDFNKFCHFYDVDFKGEIRKKKEKVNKGELYTLKIKGEVVLQ
jgi:hypothetical protein